jgi:hypothetical protein
MVDPRSLAIALFEFSWSEVTLRQVEQLVVVLRFFLACDDRVEFDLRVKITYFAK